MDGRKGKKSEFSRDIYVFFTLSLECKPFQFFILCKYYNLIYATCMQESTTSAGEGQPRKNETEKMKALNNLKTSVKLITSFLIVALLAGVVGVIGVYYMQKIDTSYTVLIDNHMDAINKMADISIAFQRTRVNIRDMLLAPNAQAAKQHVDTINQLGEQIDEGISRIRTNDPFPGNA